MTWSIMSHEKAKLKGFIPNGFILKGMTYDGDGNAQWESGTDMTVEFATKKDYKEFVKRLKRVV